MWQKDSPKNVLLCFAFLLFFFLKLILFVLSLLSSLNRLYKPHMSIRPIIQAHTVSNQIPKRPSDSTKDLPLAKWWTFKFSQSGLRWFLREMEWPVEMQKRGEKIMHVSHIVILRRQGGTEETREVNGVPHPLGQSVWEYFLQSFSGSVYILHTHRSALNWLWTCPVSFLIYTVVEGMCLPLTLDINAY